MPPSGPGSDIAELLVKKNWGGDDEDVHRAIDNDRGSEEAGICNNEGVELLEPLKDVTEPNDKGWDV